MSLAFNRSLAGISVSLSYGGAMPSKVVSAITKPLAAMSLFFRIQAAAKTGLDSSVAAACITCRCSLLSVSSILPHF